MKIKNVDELKKYLGANLYLVYASGDIGVRKVYSYGFETDGKNTNIYVTADQYEVYHIKDIITEEPRLGLTYSFVVYGDDIKYVTFDEDLAKRLAEKARDEYPCGLPSREKDKKVSKTDKKYIVISHADGYGYIERMLNVDEGLLLALYKTIAFGSGIDELEDGLYEVVWVKGEDQDNGHGDIWHIPGYWDFEKVDNEKEKEKIIWSECWIDASEYEDRGSLTVRTPCPYDE